MSQAAPQLVDRVGSMQEASESPDDISAEAPSRPPTIAILGRPNVGKSTLFNRLVGRRAALVDDTPGLTRDRREGIGNLAGLDLHLVDTAGLDATTDESLAGRMQRQTETALAAADVAFLLIDAQVGITPLDTYFARWIMKFGKPVVLIANKCEGRRAEAGVLDAYGLGLGEPVAISADHGEGLADLYAALAPLVAPVAEPSGHRASLPLGLAIVGRPNAGKSTLANRLIGVERLLTGPEPGITRDAIAVEWEFDGRQIRLVDTAGLRRRARVDDRLERLSATDALRAVRLAEVVVLVLDAEAPFERQDQTIARTVAEEGRALVIALNKWDLVVDKAGVKRALRQHLDRALPQLLGVALVPISALTGANMDGLMPAVFAMHKGWCRRIGTGPLNRWLGAVVAAHSPPAVQGRRLQLRYITQVKARPPTFALFVSRPDELPLSYMRYLENSLRKHFDLAGVPIRMLRRKGRNPYAPR